MSLPDAGRFQVHSPSPGGLFVAEPVQQANAALNASQQEWSALGLTMLEQGQTSVLHTRLEVLI